MRFTLARNKRAETTPSQVVAWIIAAAFLIAGAAAAAIAILG